MNITQQKIIPLEAVTQNVANFRIYGNSVLFQNTGTTTAVIDNSLTIPAGEARAFNTDNPFVVIAQNVNIMFSGVGTNNLEVILMATANEPEIDNYVKNLQIR